MAELAKFFGITFKQPSKLRKGTDPFKFKFTLEHYCFKETCIFHPWKASNRLFRTVATWFHGLPPIERLPRCQWLPSKGEIRIPEGYTCTSGPSNLRDNSIYIT